MRDAFGSVDEQVDAGRCALCGQHNGCAMEIARVTGVAQTECWCMRASIAVGVLERIPPEKRGLACVCERCARSASARR